LVFRLPAVGEVGDEILFRLSVLNSLWILVLAVEEGSALSQRACRVRCNKGFVRVLYFIMLLGLYCPILCD
jgi:hypothetical protein